MSIDPKNLSSTATLTFHDEFDTLNLWNGVTGAGSSGTWNTNYWWGAPNGSTLEGNGEVEWYINDLYEPTRQAIADGNIVTPWKITTDPNGSYLTLTAAPVTDPATQALINGYQYSSGMIQTYYTHTQTYGYFEMRAKLPAGQGLWPAFWLLPADGSWPPEIDIFEVLGNDMETLYTYVHTNETHRHTSRGEANVVPDTSLDFHTYGLNWQADYITWYFDGVEIFKTNTPSDLHDPMYMIANITVGGGWPGMPDGTTPWPAEMQIDYIRAYSEARNLFDLPVSGASQTVIAGGNSRANTLTGTAAADYIDGLGGIDTLKGLGGNDTYVVDETRDKVSEAAGAGIDTVLSSASSYLLPANVENLTLVGSTAQTGTGNALGNILTSNNVGSKLSGGDGNDILIAGRGADTLTGGAGKDIFQFGQLPAQTSHVTDFTSGSDMLDFSRLFKAAGFSGTADQAQLYLSSLDTTGGTVVSFDSDGAGSAAPVTITTLDNFHGSLVAQTDWFFSSPFVS
jgi:beta-glucanase (GH16 family)